MRRITVVGMIILSLVAMPLVVSAAPSTDKVEICHVTGDGDAHTISVSEKALKGHLKHGDLPLPCDAPEAPLPDDNQAPIAEIQLSFTCVFGVCEYLTFNGSSSSDPEGLPLSFFWTVTGSDGITSTHLGTGATVPVYGNTSFVVTLVVSDGELQSDEAMEVVLVP